MVKGTTRQVVVVKGTSEALFEQAIFLVKDDVISKGGVTEDLLLKEARQVCKNASQPLHWKNMLLSFSGAALTGLIWLLTVLF